MHDFVTDNWADKHRVCRGGTVRPIEGTARVHLNGYLLPNRGYWRSANLNATNLVLQMGFIGDEEFCLPRLRRSPGRAQL